MLNNSAAQIYRRPWTDASHRILGMSFIATGIGLGLVSLVAYLVSLLIRDVFTIYNNAQFTLSSTEVPEQFRTLQILMSVGSLGFFFMFIMSWIWAARIHKASIAFIIFMYALFIFTQGVSLALVFVALNASELSITVALLAGLLLISGFMSRFIRGPGFARYLMIGSLVYMIILLISLPLYFLGVYSSTVILLQTVLAVPLFMGFLAYDVYMLRKNAEWGADTGNKMMVFRVTAFFVFHFLWTIVNLFRLVAILVLSGRR